MSKEASFEIRGSASGSPSDTGDLCHRLQVCILLGYVPQAHPWSPTLKRGSIIFGYCHFKDLKAGDVIVFEHDHKLLVKRDIAACGATLSS